MEADLRAHLQRYGQAHLLPVLAQLTEPERASLLHQLKRIDLAGLQALFARRAQKDLLPTRERIAPLPYPAIAEDAREEFIDAGEHAFGKGQIAFLIVAGGQGTRLGFNDPKGMFAIGPISRKPLFQIHAEKVRALNRRYDARFPLLVMTSPATDAATRLFFKRRNYYRLPPQDVWFFCQSTMPAVDLASGQMLLEAPGRLCLSPNGHGGTITGLLDGGIFDRLEERGVRTIYYFQVDNPLANLADALFVGRHYAENAEVSSKVMPKTGPTEKVGNFLLVDGRCSMIEYSDLPDDWANEKDDAGQLKFWAGNPAIHLFDVAFLRKITAEADRLPWHLARKKVPYLDQAGNLVQPMTENALKFERFIFDVLPQAERWAVQATSRHDEFAPVKNKDGVDSPATAKAMMIAQATRWLREVDVEVAEGVKVEISPLFALDADELKAHRKALSRIEKDTYLR